MASLKPPKVASHDRSLILMISAFIAVGSFLFWLNIKAADTELAVITDTTGESSEISSAPVVDVALFGSNPMAHSDGIIRINNLLVQSGVGSQAFFVEIPGQPGPYLVKLGPDVVADSVSVPSGSRASVIGNIYTMTDSVADDWVAIGAITEDDKILASFAESFLEALDIIVMDDGG
jgi:hypothetical protein